MPAPNDPSDTRDPQNKSLALLSVEVAFDTTTFFAGDRINAVVTFKNLCKLDDTASTSSPPEVSINARVVDPRNSSDSFSNRLSMQLSSSMRDLYAHLDSPTSSMPTTLGTITSGLSRWASFRIPRAEAKAETVTVQKTTTTRVPTHETLLMGYAQLEGHFNYDEELVRPQAFQRARRHSSALFGDTERSESNDYSEQNDRLNNSSGGGSNMKLFHPNHHKSILSSPGSGIIVGGRGASMKTSTTKIPIFATPQSLLFVDLNLQPGESRSFTYSVDLPRCLPPSSRNKAVQIYYNLVIGVQRAPLRGLSRTPQSKMVFVPFRVLPYIDPSGQSPIHDLETPLILREDCAQVVTVESPIRAKRRRHSEFIRATLQDLINSYANLSLDGSSDIVKDSDDIKDFNDYIARLMDSTNLIEDGKTPMSILKNENNIDCDNNNNPQRLPSPQPSPRQSISHKQRLTNHQEVFENIHRAIHAPRPPLRIKCQYAISRNQIPIASLSLCKPIYRLGDTITLTLDFDNHDIPCYHVMASLETTETLDPTISTKSRLSQNTPSSFYHTQFATNQILALTRRVYAQESTTILNTRSRLVIQLAIPPSATPQFATSKVTTQWSLTLAILTKFSPNNGSPNSGSPNRNDSPNRNGSPSINGSPNRNGSPIRNYSPNNAQFNEGVYVAPATLDTESFNCRIPLQVLPTNYDMGSLVGVAKTHGYVIW